MKHPLLFLFAALAPLLQAAAQEHVPSGIPATPTDSMATAPTAPTAFPRLPVATDDYVPSCLLSDEEIARRFAFDTPAFTPVISSWRSGVVWADAAAASFPGMAGVENGTVGISQNVGRLRLSAYGSAVKYGYFRGLSTQWSFGGSLQWQFAPRLGITLFGSYATAAYRPGMAPGVSEMLSMPSFGGYVSWDITDRFGVDVGASMNRTSLSSWEARPIVAPYIRTGSAKVSVDVGGILYEILRSRGSAGPANPTIGPPKPLIPIAPRD